MTILLVEDDVAIVDFLSRGLEAEGYGVRVARTGAEAAIEARAPDLALVILDLMLPDGDGRELCRELRAGGVQTPILMLTALASLEDKIAGLRMGADDYLTKPFSFEELLARIEALLRRSQGLEPRQTSLRVADLVLDRATLEVRRADRPVTLTAKELALLECLMTAQGRVLSRARILARVWGRSSDPLTNVVDVYIRRLRAKIDDDFDRPLIHTVRGYGYCIRG